MHMRINQPGEDRRLAEIADFDSRRHTIQAHNSFYFFVAHQQRSLSNPFRSHDSTRLKRLRATCPAFDEGFAQQSSPVLPERTAHHRLFQLNARIGKSIAGLSRFHMQ
jgi:hypothetical protein